MVSAINSAFANNPASEFPNCAAIHHNGNRYKRNSKICPSCDKNPLLNISLGGCMELQNDSLFDPRRD